MLPARGALALLASLVVGGAVLAQAPQPTPEMSIVTGSTGLRLEILRRQLDQFERYSGYKVRIVARPSSSSDQLADYKLWLAGENAEIDVFRTESVWAPQLAGELEDLKEPLADVLGGHFPEFVGAQTIAGRVVALPIAAEAPVLFYRKDLLDKHGFKPPATWAELTATARAVMEKERAEGNAGLWGYVFQGAAYEGLTGNALEWIASSGGGSIVEPDGSVSVDNPRAAAALDLARAWVGAIAPPEVLSFTEEEARAVWNAGNAVFMRNWPYAYALSASPDSAVQGLFDIAPLPAGPGGRSVATLGGWNLTLSRDTRHRDAGLALIRFLAAREAQEYRALEAADLPTLPALYDDADIAEEQPALRRWKPILESARARPAAVTGEKYPAVSKEVWTAVHDTLAGRGTAAENLASLRSRLEMLRGAGW